MLCLPRNLTRPCENVLPITKSVSNLAKVLYLLRNLYIPPYAPIPMGFTIRPCQRYGNAILITKSIFAFAKISCLPQNLPRLAKVLHLPCNSNFAKPPHCYYNEFSVRPHPDPVPRFQKTVSNRRCGRDTSRTSSVVTSYPYHDFVHSLSSRTFRQNIGISETGGVDAHNMRKPTPSETGAADVCDRRKPPTSETGAVDARDRRNS